MASAPAISSVYAAVVAAVEAITPAVRPSVSFASTTDDPRELPADGSAERQFRLAFRGLLRSEPSVLAPGLADRVVRFTLEVAYPALELDAAPDLRLASDAELIHRAMRRVPGTKRIDVETTLERGEDLVIAVHALAVAYRDQE